MLKKLSIHYYTCWIACLTWEEESYTVHAKSFGDKSLFV